MINITYPYKIIYFFLMVCQAFSIRGQQFQNPNIEDRFITSTSIFTNPELLFKIPIDTIPVAIYSKEMTRMQKLINKKNTSWILSAQVNGDKSWTEIDHEEITPFTWRWIDMEISYNSVVRTRISLRRPLWWMKTIGADKVGNRIYVDMPEMGVQDTAIVTHIRINQLDSRLFDGRCEGNLVARPITGKFIHFDKSVYDLYFKGNSKPLGVTKNHLLWSADEDVWKTAFDLRIGENVRTATGTSTLLRRERKTGMHQVYNIEVFRDHNYHVSIQSVLAHNECWSTHWNILGKTYDDLIKGGKNSKGYVLSDTKQFGPLRLFYSLANQKGNSRDFIQDAWRSAEKVAIAHDKNKLIIKVEVSPWNPLKNRKLVLEAEEFGYKLNGEELVDWNGKQKKIYTFSPSRGTIWLERPD